MKMLLLSTCGILMVSFTALPQGSILFQNVWPGGSAPMRDPCERLIANGAPYTVELLAGTDASSVAPLEPPITTTNWAGNGWFGVGEPERVLPGFAPGSSPFLQVRLWENGFGAAKTYAEAIAQGRFYGQSTPWQLGASLGNPEAEPPVPAPALIGLTSFSCLGCGFVWISNPTNQTVFAGGRAVFTVEVLSPSIPVPIQWQFASQQTNWSDIFGATNLTLVIDPVSGTAEGFYRATSSWACGGASSSATLSVVDPPRFESFSVAPSDRSFSFTMSSEPGLAFRIDASTNLIDWVPLITVTNTAGSLILSDPEALNFTHRFYRALVSAP